MVGNTLLLVGVEVASANLFESDTSKHGVEKAFQKVKHVRRVVFGNTLDPFNGDFVFLAVELGSLDWYFGTVFKRIDASLAEEYKEAKVFLFEFFSLLGKNFISETVWVVWNFRFKLDCVLEDVFLVWVGEGEGVEIGHKFDWDWMDFVGGGALIAYFRGSSGSFGEG
jgi:hypothetical protein